jgi:hypothetical protein
MQINRKKFRFTGLKDILLMAPIIFILHFLEEAPAFVSWFNGYADRDISSGLFWTVNLSGLFISLMVVWIEWASPSLFSSALTILWLSFLMMANAVFHIIAAILEMKYVPGLFTAVLLYIPFYWWVMIKTRKEKKLAAGLMIVLALLGALPMLVHGYRVLFLADRLF